MEQEVDNDVDVVADEWLGSCSEVLSSNGVDSSLSYICRREYTIECNWKVWVNLFQLNLWVPHGSFQNLRTLIFHDDT